MKFQRFAAFLLAMTAAWALFATSAEAQARTTSDGVYSDTQSDRGEDLFDVVCSSCHLSVEFEGIVQDWEGSSVFELYEQIRTTMPEDGPGSLQNQEYADVVAYLLNLNGVPAGDGDLAGEGDVLKDITMAAPGHEDR